MSLSHLPGLVMIISVPMPWKDFQRSESSRVILMLLPWWKCSGPPAMEDGGMLKLGFISRVKEKVNCEIE